MRGAFAFLAIAIGLVIGAVAAQAQTCADYGAQSRWEGTLWLHSDFPALDYGKGLAARNDTLVVVDGGDQLYVIDAGAPTQMKQVGSLDRRLSGIDIAWRGDYAFVVSLDSLRVVSLADPTHPQVVAMLGSQSPPMAATVAGDLLLVACDQGLWIVDVSAPLAPATFSFLPLGDEAVWDVTVAGNVAWLAQDPGLVAVDVSDPAHPAVVGQLGGLGWVGAVAVRDDVAYVAGEALTTVDVSDSAHPAPLGSLAAWGTDIALEGDLACLSATTATAVVDIHDPAHPALLSSDTSGDYFNKGIVARDGHLFVARMMMTLADGFEVRAGRLDPHAAPERLGTWTWAGANQNLDVNAAVADGDLAYCLLNSANSDGADCAGTLQILDLSDPAAPRELGSLDLLHVREAGIAKSGSHVLVAGADLQVIDVSDPASPALVGSLPLLSNPCAMAPWSWGRRLQVSGDRALAVVPQAGSPSEWDWALVDISEIASPQSLGALPPRLQTGDLQIAGDLAYASTGDSLLVFDLTNPAAPIQIGGASSGNVYGTWLMLVRRGLAYARADLPGYNARLDIFDVSDPDHIVLRGSTNLPAFPGVAELRGNRLYLGNNLWGETCVVDVSDPTTPRYLGPVTTGVNATALTSAGNCLVLGPSHGVTLMPLACGQAVPVFVSSFTATRVEGGVAIQWNYAGEDPGEFRLTAISTGPRGVSGGGGVLSWDVPFTASGEVFTARDASARLAAGGAVTYTLDHRADAVDPWLAIGERSVDLDTPQQPVALLAPHPNPFNPLVRIPFVLAQPQRARLTVFDVAGRRIATLADGLFAAGAQEASWDGTDSRGVPAASGNYFLRLDGERGQDARRVMLVR